MSKETNRTPRSVSRNLTLASVIGGLYAVLVVALAPISFLPVQIRFADALLPLAILFGWPVALGLAIGAGVGNLVGDLLGGFFPSSSVGIDVVGGSIANLVAALLAWKIGNSAIRIPVRFRWILATVVETLTVTLIVGPYLSVLFAVPLDVSIIGVFLGSVVAINVAGNLVLNAVATPQTLRRLRSWGLLVQVRDIPD